MSKQISHEEALDLPLRITLQIEEFWRNQGIYDLTFDDFKSQQEAYEKKVKRYFLLKDYVPTLFNNPEEFIDSCDESAYILQDELNHLEKELSGKK